MIRAWIPAFIPPLSQVRLMTQMNNSTPQIIVVGLGNLPMPGTRHSLGQLVVDGLADRLGIRMSSDRKGVIGRDIVTIGDTDIQLTLYKSKAAMNISGPSIAEAFRNSIKPTGSTTTHNLIVLQDSLDHLPATLSTRIGGSANGHNGIKSIISALGGKKDFYRFRLGIGRDERGGANYVLGRLPSQEKQYWREEGLDEVLNEIEKVAWKLSGP